MMPCRLARSTGEPAAEVAASASTSAWKGVEASISGQGQARSRRRSGLGKRKSEGRGSKKEVGASRSAFPYPSTRGSHPEWAVSRLGFVIDFGAAPLNRAEERAGWAAALDRPWLCGHAVLTACLAHSSLARHTVRSTRGHSRCGCWESADEILHCTSETTARAKTENAALSNPSSMETDHRKGQPREDVQTVMGRGGDRRVVSCDGAPFVCGGVRGGA